MYVLQNGNTYCLIDGNNTIRKTNSINKATKFKDFEKAEKNLHRATKKLKDFEVVEIDLDNVPTREKRKHFSTNERVAIYNKNKGRCAICGKFVPYDTFTVDHVIPLSKGGTNDLSNLQCTHQSCNLMKQDNSPDELTKKLMEIMLYQMKLSWDDSLWRKMNYLRKRKRKMEIAKLIKHVKRKGEYKNEIELSSKFLY